MILYCGCTHCLGGTAGAKFQDSRYGVGMRVHNAVPVTNKSDEKWRCTICESVRTAGK